MVSCILRFRDKITNARITNARITVTLFGAAWQRGLSLQARVLRGQESPQGPPRVRPRHGPRARGTPQPLLGVRRRQVTP